MRDKKFNEFFLCLYITIFNLSIHKSKETKLGIDFSFYPYEHKSRIKEMYIPKLFLSNLSRTYSVYKKRLIDFFGVFSNSSS